MGFSPTAVGAALLTLATVAEGADTLKWGPGATVSAPKSHFTFALAGYIQEDGRSFPNWDPGDVEGEVLRGKSTELRRFRIGFEAEWRRLTFELDVDPQDTGDRLKNAFLDLRVAKALQVRGGHFKVPVSREFLTSAGKTDFIERSLLADDIGPARDLGVMLHGELGKWLEYQAGVFAGDGRTRHDRAETTIAARVLVVRVKGLEYGMSFSQGDVTAEAEVPGGDPRPKGIVGNSPSGFRFYERRFVNGRRLRLGAEAAYLAGPFSIKAELLQGREERLGQGSILDDLPEEVVTGWSASATWLLTGEKKRNSIKPKERLFKGPGAVELGFRVESLKFDDDGPATGFAGAGNRARNIRPAADRVLTGGISWWPISWVRVMGNVVVERFEDPLLAPEPGRQGNYVTVLGRLQLQVP